MKVAVTTLGCKVNQAESAAIMGALREQGYEIVNSNENPDACIINTCTVTAKSDYQSRQMIRRAVKSGARVVATGCYAQLRPDELSEIKGIDLVLGNSEKAKINNYIVEFNVEPDTSPQPPLTKGGSEGGLLKGGRADFRTRALVDSPETPLQIGSYYSNRARAFLKIQDGCDFSCSYCTVPMARGKSRSLSPEDVLKAVEKFISDGYKEIVLTGVHIGSYGLELKPESSLLEIVKKITACCDKTRIRLSSIEPQELKKDFLTLIKKGRLCPHLHIPLQSGSNAVLRAMNRRYSASFFKSLIQSIASTCPGISIGTDIIAGFPGESEKDFQDTVNLLQEMPLSYIHVFPYSKRPDTRAAAFASHVSDDVKKKRVDRLLEISKKKKNDYLTMHLGKYLNVIVESRDTTDGFYRAISDNYIRLLVRADRLIRGQKLAVEAVSMSNGGLISIPA